MSRVTHTGLTRGPVTLGGGAAIPALYDGLVAYWSLDETSGNRADSHGSNTLADNNTVGAAAALVNDGALFVKANTEYLSAIDSAPLAGVPGTSLTITAWVKPTTNANHGIVGKYATGNAEYFLALETGRAAFSVNTPAGIATGIYAFTHVADTWYFLIGEYNAATGASTVSVNLVAGAPVVRAGGVTPGTAQFRLGNSGLTGYAANALIDEVAIWHRVLTAEEKLYVYNGGLARSYGALGSYPDTSLYRNASEPALIITFDDGDKSVYTAAYPLMQARNIPGTAYIIGNTLPAGSASRMSLAELAVLQNAEWCIGNHGFAHQNLIGQSVETITSELQGGLNALNQYGLSRHSRHLAYSWGYPDANMIAVAESIGSWTARAYDAVDPGDHDYAFVNANGLLYKIPSYRQITPTMPVATATGWIDAAIANNSIAVVLFHNIVVSPTVNNEWSIADFEAFLDYAVSSGIRCITMADWYNEYTSRYGG